MRVADGKDDAQVGRPDGHGVGVAVVFERPQVGGELGGECGEFSVGDAYLHEWPGSDRDRCARNIDGGGLIAGVHQDRGPSVDAADANASSGRSLELSIEHSCGNTIGTEDEANVCVLDLDDSHAACLERQANTLAVDDDGVAAAFKAQTFSAELCSQDGELCGATWCVTSDFEAHER